MVKDAIGDGKDFPKFTHDAQVNHAVDLEVMGWVVPWEDLSKNEQDLYFAEVEAAKKQDKWDNSIKKLQSPALL